MQIKKRVFIIILLLISTVYSFADEMSMFLGEPVITGSYSDQEKAVIARSLNGKITTALLGQPDVLLIGDREIEALLAEAERRMALNCDSDECFAMMSQMLDTDYVVRCDVSPDGSGTAAIQLRLQERSGQALSLVSFAEAGNIDPFNEREVNWYAEQLVTKLFDQGHEIQAYRGGVNFEVVFEDQEEIEIDEIQPRSGGRERSIEEVEVQEEAGPMEIRQLDLPQVQINFASDDSEYVADILWELIRGADRLVENREFEQALSSYNDIQERVQRYVQQYPDLEQFVGVVEDRILEARRYEVSVMIQDADRISNIERKIDRLEEIQQWIEGQENAVQQGLSEEAALLEERMGIAYGNRIAEIISEGDSLLNRNRFDQADDQYVTAMRQTRIHSRYLDNSSELISLLEDRRAAVCVEEIEFLFPDEDQEDPVIQLSAWEEAQEYFQENREYLESSYIQYIRSGISSAHKALVREILEQGDARQEADFSAALGSYIEAGEYIEEYSDEIRDPSIAAVVQNRILRLYQYHTLLKLDEGEALYREQDFHGASRIFREAAGFIENADEFSITGILSESNRSGAENAVLEAYNSAQEAYTQSFETGQNVFANQLQVCRRMVVRGDIQGRDDIVERYLQDALWLYYRFPEFTEATNARRDVETAFMLADRDFDQAWLEAPWEYGVQDREDIDFMQDYICFLGVVEFTGRFPENGSSTIDTTPLLVWDDVTGAVSYELETADTEARLDGTGAQPVTASQYQVEQTLSVGDTRYWRLRAVNGDGLKSAWSSVLSFEVAYRTYRIGDTGPAGGIIFYDDEADGVDDIPDARYLECAPESTEWRNIEWGVRREGICGAYGAAVGTGEQNTQDILASQGTGSTYAAQLCDGLEYGGYSDWFLPSKGELDLMRENLHRSGIGGFAGGSYWSSSEHDAGSAWEQDFTCGYRYNFSKYRNFRVRAVRAF